MSLALVLTHLSSEVRKWSYTGKSIEAKPARIDEAGQPY
jgi:hypothetical protein